MISSVRDREITRTERELESTVRLLAKQFDGHIERLEARKLDDQSTRISLGDIFIDAARIDREAYARGAQYRAAARRGGGKNQLQNRSV